MPKKINLFFSAAELTPIAKVGGLGDVAGSLPKALLKLGVNFSSFIPFHKKINKSNLKNLKLIKKICVPFHKKNELVEVWQANFPKTKQPLYLFKNNKYLSIGGVYKTDNLISPLTGKRTIDGVFIKYLFFAKAIYHFIKQTDITFDIFHFNDWHLVPLLLLLRNDKKYKNIKALYTIHNLPNKGVISPQLYSLLEIPKKFNSFPNKNGGVNLMKLGIIYADIINTVSVNYSKEIQTKEYSAGMLKELRVRKKDIYGVVNGLDLDLFNPKNDVYLPFNFSLKTISKKTKNKKFIQKKSGLAQSVSIPVFGLVSRLFEQKGIDLILEIMPELMKLNAQFIFTGTGKPQFEKAFEKTQAKYPDKFYFLNAFDIPFGQQIYGGADMFLMPSLYEPCGLGQMIAMEYASVPIVRATGGLADTVTEGKTGFVFKKYNSQELLKAIKRSINAFQNKSKWQAIIKNSMTADHSWDKSAKEYLKLYKKCSTKIIK